MAAAMAMAMQTRQGSFHKFHAVRTCDSLKAPAIFLDYEDCSFYLDQDENDGSVEYHVFEDALEALEYLGIVGILPKNPPPAAAAAAICASTFPPTVATAAAVSVPNNNATASAQGPTPLATNPLLTMPPALPFLIPRMAPLAINPLLASIATAVPAGSNLPILRQPTALLTTVPTVGIPVPVTVPYNQRVLNISTLAAHSSAQHRPVAIPTVGVPAPYNQLLNASTSIAAPSSAKTCKLKVAPSRSRSEGQTEGLKKGKQVQQEKRKERVKTQIAQLQQHFEKHGSFDVTDKHLKRFVQDMRRQILNHKISPETYERLEAIGFVEEVKQKGNETSFDSKVRRLREYHREHCSFDVTDKQAYPQLSGFSKRMLPEIRKYLVKPSTSILSEDQFQKLEAIGLVDEAKGTSNFDEKLQQLREYHAKNNNSFDIKDSYELRDLFLFVRRMRKEIRKFRSKAKDRALTQEQFEQLDVIGLVEQVALAADPKAETQEKRDRQWEEMFERVQQFQQDQNGRLPHKSTDAAELANWVHQQKLLLKKAAKKGKDVKISTQQMARLTTLGIQSTMNFYKTFEERIRDYVDYKHEHHQEPPGKSILGGWSRKTKWKYMKWKLGEKTNLTPAIVEQLTTAGLEWPTLEEIETFRTAQPMKRKSWDERFQELLDFKRRTGHLMVAQKQGQLGSWVHDQRSEYRKFKNGKKSSLNANRLGQLLEIGFTFSAKGWSGQRDGKGQHSSNAQDSDEEDYSYPY